MEIALRTALLAWLASDPALTAQLNGIHEEAPASASSDWSCKSAPGREVRVALELHCRGDAPEAAGALVTAIEARTASLPRSQPDFQVVSIRFLRARAEQRAESRRAVLIEFAFRLLGT